MDIFLYSHTSICVGAGYYCVPVTCKVSQGFGIIYRIHILDSTGAYQLLHKNASSITFWSTFFEILSNLKGCVLYHRSECI